MNTEPCRKIQTNPLTEPLLQLCERIRSFLEEQVRREMSNLPLAASLERTPDGELCVRKQLAFGVVFLATPSREDLRTVTLQIFFDPARFRTWRAGLGPVTQLYLNPYGLELVLDHKVERWGLYLVGDELHIDLETDEIYEVANLEIRDESVVRST